MCLIAEINRSSGTCNRLTSYKLVTILPICKWLTVHFYKKKMGWQILKKKFLDSLASLKTMLDSVIQVETAFCGEVGFGIWLKHHRKIWKLTRRRRVSFPIFRSVWKPNSKSHLSTEGYLLLTPRFELCFSETPWKNRGVWVKHHGFSVEFGLNS